MAAETGQGRAEASLSAVERWWEAGQASGGHDGGDADGPVGGAGDGTGGGPGRGGRPDWAALAEEMVAAAPEEAVAPEGEYPGLTGFAWVLRPFTAGAGERLERGVSERAGKLVDMTAVRGDLERQLSGRLARAAARTLILELHEARTAGRLDGDDSRARFRDFLGRTASRRGLAALLAGRPVLARILGRAALDAADAVVEARADRPGGRRPPGARRRPRHAGGARRAQRPPGAGRRRTPGDAHRRQHRPGGHGFGHAAAGDGLR